jgi:hypothetical protein
MKLVRVENCLKVSRCLCLGESTAVVISLDNYDFERVSVFMRQRQWKAKGAVRFVNISLRDIDRAPIQNTTRQLG